MTSAQFIAKWSPVTLSERAASQEHFIDLVRLLGQATPAEHDATGAEYTFDKGVTVTAPASKGSKGESGFADVWWRGKFGWEYKRKDKHKDLIDAYRQLCQYSEDLDDPCGHNGSCIGPFSGVESAGSSCGKGRDRRIVPATVGPGPLAQHERDAVRRST